MTVKELFDKAENNTLTWEQFQTAMGDAKFVDLNEGGYVSKQKYDHEIGQRDTTITQLNDTIATRDNDLKALQTTLKDAGDIEELSKTVGLSHLPYMVFFALFYFFLACI